MRTLAIHPGALGDVVLFARLLSRLDGEVTLVAGGAKAALAAGLGVVDGALDFDALPMHEVFTDAPPERCRLPALLGRCDRLVSSFAAGEERAEQRLTELCAARSAHFLPIRPPAEARRHLVDFWLDTLGVDRPTTWPAWPTLDAWRDDAREHLTELGVKPDGLYAVIHPGAGGRRKCWPVGRFVRVAERLRASGTPFVFVLGPVELETWTREDVDSIRRAGPALLDPPLSVLAGVFAGAAGMLGNDSGASHLAAAVGTPTVALFGPTRPEQFAPLGPRVRSPAADSMDMIEAATVERTLRELIRSPH